MYDIMGQGKRNFQLKIKYQKAYIESGVRFLRYARGERVEKDLEYLLSQARRIAEHREKGAMQAIRKQYKSLLTDLKRLPYHYV